MRGRCVVIGVAFALAFALAASDARAQAQETILNAAPAQEVAAPEVPPPVVERPLAPPIYDNGPLVTHPGGGCSGGDASRLQGALGMMTYGLGAQIGYGYRMSDDFTVCGAWQIDSITFFVYQTDSGTTSTINDLRLQIWDGPPNDGGAVIWGDMSTNRLASTGFSGIYRDIDSGAGDCRRPIMYADVTVGTTLEAGTYWVDVSFGGSGSSGPWVPPTTVLGSTSPCSPCNALQYTTAWNNALDLGTGTQQDIKFEVYGTAFGTDVSIDKVGPDGVLLGGSVSYTLTVTNNSPFPATSLVVTDTLPAGVTYVSAGGGSWTCSEAGGVVTCTLPTLAASTAAADILIDVTAPAVVGDIVNEASVSACGTDPNPSNNHDSVTTGVVAELPAITSADAARFKILQPGSFTVTTTGDPTAAITRSGALPRGVTLVDNRDGTATLSGTPAARTAGIHTFDLVADNGAIAVQPFALTVIGAPTTTAVASYPRPSMVGQPVRLTARVGFTTRLLGAPTGTVTFHAGPVEIGTVPVVGAAASITYPFPDPGVIRVWATYSGDSSFAPSKGILAGGQIVGVP